MRVFRAAERISAAPFLYVSVRLQNKKDFTEKVGKIFFTLV